jgi:pullulanase
MKKRIYALLMSLVMVVSIFAISPFATIKTQAAGATIIIHYQRADKAYDGWNLWAWEDGKDGKAVKFTEDDDYGKVAIYKTNSDVAKLGFIVRLNDWEAKDIGDDRFIEVKDGFAEVWLQSDNTEVMTAAPAGATAYDVSKIETPVADDSANVPEITGEGLQVKIHYHRYDGVYDGWNVWTWPDTKEGAAYPFNGTDEFGAVAAFALPNTEDVAKFGFIVRLNEWELKDGDSDRFVDIANANNGVVEIYLLESDSNVYFSRDEIDLSPIFLKAGISSATKIDFQVTMPFDISSQTAKDDMKIVDTAGKEYKIKAITTTKAGLTSNGTLIMEEELDLIKQYIISKEGYGEKFVSMGDVFGSEDFSEKFTYDGKDLGATYSKEKTDFRLWAPTATAIKLNLYSEGLGENLIKTIDMTADVKGTWITSVNEDLNGVYYTYTVSVDGKENEAVDPYARTTGANGKRAMVINLDETDPEGWDKVDRPEFINDTDAVIYELHVRDLSSDASSGIQNVGKFLGLTETGTKNASGLATGLDHMKDLGITHLHLLPSFDYRTVDETRLDKNQFNWGYDPQHYNVPEGSYSTDPTKGEVRVNEFKQMVQTLHENEIRVVMDVVYNHTSLSADSDFNKIVPNYYYRTIDGKFSNGSGCGNETASERAMVRKFIVESVVYWATEYKVDGFRFDLMGLHDIETMKAVRAALDEIDPSIIVYGEGWTGGSSPLKASEAAIKINTWLMPGIAAFSDDIRDGLKGHVFTSTEPGYVSGAQGKVESIKFGIVGSTSHNQILYPLASSTSPWADAPGQSINYVSAHDNLALWDKFAVSNPNDSVEDRIKMNKLATAVVMTSQGIPFFQAGEEILRSKPSSVTEGKFDENSYVSPDSTNSIKWDTKTDNIDVYNYYKGLIAFRKAHSALRMTTTEDVQNNLTFIDGLDENVIAYTIDNSPNKEKAKSIMVILNPNKEATTLDLPEGTWNVYINGEKAGTEIIETIKDGKATVNPISSLVLVQEGSESVSDNNMVIYIAIGAALLIVAVASFVIVKKRKNIKK